MDIRDYESQALWYAECANEWAQRADTFRTVKAGDPDNATHWRNRVIRMSQDYAAKDAEAADKFLMWANK